MVIDWITARPPDFKHARYGCKIRGPISLSDGFEHFNRHNFVKPALEDHGNPLILDRPDHPAQHQPIWIWHKQAGPWKW